jgi:hypothetical protein
MKGPDMEIKSYHDAVAAGWKAGVDVIDFGSVAGDGDASKTWTPPGNKSAFVYGMYATYTSNGFTVKIATDETTVGIVGAGCPAAALFASVANAGFTQFPRSVLPKEQWSLDVADTSGSTNAIKIIIHRLLEN